MHNVISGITTKRIVKQYVTQKQIGEKKKMNPKVVIKETKGILAMGQI